MMSPHIRSVLSRSSLLLGLLGAVQLLSVGCGGPLTPLETESEGTVSETTAASAWESIGVGVNYRGTGNAGENVFIGYAGYNVSDSQSKAWTDALYAARLSALGVGHLYAVRGPADVTYVRREIGNTKLIAHLLPKIGSRTKLITIASHSSGSYVANELLGFLYTSKFDSTGKTFDKTVYFNLDGGGGITWDAVNRLYRTFFAYSKDGRSGTLSPNAAGMISLANSFVPRAGSIVVPADAAGCASGASWCLHMTLINQRPHNPSGTDLRDYSDFSARPVQTGYLDQAWPLLDGLAKRP